MKGYPLEQVVAVARRKSPYYRKLYAKVPEAGFRLADLPPVVHSDFWAGDSLENSAVLTGPFTEGILFKSGGTTGSPKFTVYARDEWQTMCEALGWGLQQNGLEEGARVGNLFYAGELYSSFIFINNGLQTGPLRVAHFPISGAAPVEFTLQAMRDFKIDVLLGIPTMLLKLVEAAREKGTAGLKLRKIYFGGETMYPDQRAFIESVFPGILIRSIQYASVDGGLMGYADTGCGFNEHRPFPELNLVEILDDETGRPIEEPGREGTLLVTSLFRLLMPIIRYPVGDRAVWAEPAGPARRKFAVRGRSEEGVRIGVVTLYSADMRALLAEVRDRYPVLEFQMLITHEEKRDKLTLRLASHLDPARRSAAEQEITALLNRERHAFPESVEKKIIHPLAFQWVVPGELAVNPRTGKLRVVCDQRFGPSGA